MLEHLLEQTPVLTMAVPLIGGIMSVFMGRGNFPWLWASIVSFCTFALSILLMQQVTQAEEQVISYALGNWAAPWGIEYRVDLLNSFVILIVSGIASIVTFYSRQSVANEISADRVKFFYSLWLLTVTGLLGITITGDAFNVYVLLEISSLTIYGLIAMGKGRDRRALTATINYIILGSIGATFILLGIGYLYMVTGTLNMADMHERLQNIQESRTVFVAFAFLMVGLCIKMALFPLHTWLPNAYTYAPTAASALLASTATKVGVYMAIRFIYTIFGLDFSFGRIPNNAILMVCACLGILIGSLSAIRQSNLKRLLAYSSVGQIGYIVLGFAMVNANANDNSYIHSANVHGVTASMVHILNHAIVKAGLFMAVGCIIFRFNHANLPDLKGLGRRMPLTAAAFVVGGLGLIGVPFTGAFISKWYLIAAAFEHGFQPLAGVVLVGSIFALIYVWRVVEVFYFHEASEESLAIDIQEAPLGMLIPTWICLGASIYFGIFASQTSQIATSAAKVLLEGVQ